MGLLFITNFHFISYIAVLTFGSDYCRDSYSYCPEMFSNGFRLLYIYTTACWRCCHTSNAYAIIYKKRVMYMHTCARTSHQCAGVVILSFYLLVLFIFKNYRCQCRRLNNQTRLYILYTQFWPCRIPPVFLCSFPGISYP